MIEVGKDYKKQPWCEKVECPSGFRKACFLQEVIYRYWLSAKGRKRMMDQMKRLSETDPAQVVKRCMTGFNQKSGYTIIRKL